MARLGANLGVARSPCLVLLALAFEVDTRKAVLNIAQPTNLRDESFRFESVIRPTARKILKLDNALYDLAAGSEPAVTDFVQPYQYSPGKIELAVAILIAP